MQTPAYIVFADVNVSKDKSDQLLLRTISSLVMTHLFLCHFYYSQWQAVAIASATLSWDNM